MYGAGPPALFAALLWLSTSAAAGSAKCADVVVNPEAAIKLGLLVRAHKSSGLSPERQCDLPNSAGIQVYEAVRFALRRINQNRGQVDGRIVHDSFIPGIKLGVNVVDTCHRDTDPARRLAACTTADSRMVGVIDGSGSELPSDSAPAGLPLLTLEHQRRLSPEETARIAS